MVSKFQWKPFGLATQRDPQNDCTDTQNRVNYDVFAQAPLVYSSLNEVRCREFGKKALFSSLIIFSSSTAFLSVPFTVICASLDKPDDTALPPGDFGGEEDNGPGDGGG